MSDASMYIRSIIKTPKQRGDKVYVHDGNGVWVATYDALELGKAYFSMSNDMFYNIYGFSFVPSGALYEKSKRAAGKL